MSTPRKMLTTWLLLWTVAVFGHMDDVIIFEESEGKDEDITNQLVPLGPIRRRLGEGLEPPRRRFGFVAGLFVRAVAKVAIKAVVKAVVKHGVKTAAKKAVNYGVKKSVKYVVKKATKKTVKGVVSHVKEQVVNHAIQIVQYGDKDLSNVELISAHGYRHVSKGCVPDGDIVLYSAKTVEECAILCDQESRCKAFEYGVSHGGADPTYKVKDCQLQHAVNYAGCDGGHYNLDLYVKEFRSGKSEYAQLAKGCVFGHDIQFFNGKSVTECADLCDSNSRCVAFEYGVAYGGVEGNVKVKDCILQDSDDYSDCDGTRYNLDLYLKATVTDVEGCDLTRSICCDYNKKWNMVPHVTWGTTPASEKKWFEDNDCNNVMGGHLVEYCPYSCQEQSACINATYQSGPMIHGNANANDKASCRARCNETDGCNFWDFDTSVSICRLRYNSGNGPVAYSPAWGGDRDCIFPGEHSACVNATYESGPMIHGNANANDKASCRARCNETAGCNFWDFDTSVSICRLRSSSGNGPVAYSLAWGGARDCTL